MHLWLAVISLNSCGQTFHQTPASALGDQIRKRRALPFCTFRYSFIFAGCSNFPFDRLSPSLSHSLSTNCQREEKTKQAEWWPAKITSKSIRFLHRQMRPLPAKLQLPSTHQAPIFQMTTISAQKRRYFTRKSWFLFSSLTSPQLTVHHQS